MLLQLNKLSITPGRLRISSVDKNNGECKNIKRMKRIKKCRQIRRYTVVKLMEYIVNTYWFINMGDFQNDLECRLIYVTGKLKSNNISK